jgi:hypothetical protein
VALMALITAGILVFLVTSLSPDAIDAYRARKTSQALAEAREALLGYTLKYRDEEAAQGRPDRMYGYLPLPDLGSSRNNNVACVEEGCDAANFAGNTGNVTVIGRLPWRTLGVAPLRDGHGECLWLAVSGSHQRVHQAAPMNWDTVGQLDVVVANDSSTLTSTLASPHERPIAIVFAPGHTLPGQNRSPSTTDDIRQCGGNYNVAQYLDPGTATALAGIANYFPGATNNSFGNTGAAFKPLAPQGPIYRRNDGTLWPGGCPGSAGCDLAANDGGLVLTPDTLFEGLRKSSAFRNDINAMLDRVAACLSDTVGSLAPSAITGTAADKIAGRIPSDTCYGDNNPPQGYFTHWREMLLVAKPPAGNFTNVTVDGQTRTCAAVLMFAGQRAGQTRATTADKDTLTNYLEGANLNSFTTVGSSAFAGASQLGAVRANKSNPTDIDRCTSGGVWTVSPECHTLEQDIVRCIPPGGSFSLVTSPTLTALGFDQLVAYDPGTRTLTLGHAGVTTGAGAPVGALFGCAWQPEAHPLGNGLHAYFQFRFRMLGTSVGDNGFVFSTIDAEANGTNACGASGSHLGYSGSNGVTPPLTFPKLGIEFDQGRNAGFSETGATAGRNDPCGATGCGGTVGYNSHAAIVYWGHQTASAIDGVTLPGQDDNVHGFPTAASLAGIPRPEPRNPAPAPGTSFVNLRGQASDAGNSYLYHVRVELTPTRNITGIPPEQRATTLRTQVWIERESGTSAQLIAAMQNTTRPMAQNYPGYAARLQDTAVIYDVPGSACGSGCPAEQGCGSDNVCYRQAMRSVRLGFSGSQRTQDQQVEISNFFASWPE